MGMSVEDLAKELCDTCNKVNHNHLPYDKLESVFQEMFKQQARHLLSKLDISHHKSLSSQADDDVQAAVKRGFNS